MFNNIKSLAAFFEEELERSINVNRPGFFSKKLNHSMKYSLLSEGKRLRPLMVFACAATNGDNHKDIKKALNGALAVEYVHAYSLIHDDLPCMDNDLYRRGKPSNHMRFGEGIAVLAGDAMLADAFYWASKSVNGQKVCEELSLTAGSFGLCAGQTEDLESENKSTSTAMWQKINQAKTARLYEACSVIGALSFFANKKELQPFRDLGNAFGKLFQLKDDLDDNAGLSRVMSKEVALKNYQKDALKLKHVIDKFPHNDLLVELFYSAFANLLL